MRFTVEENVIIPNVPEDRLEALQAEPLFARFPIHGGERWRAGAEGAAGWRRQHCCVEACGPRVRVSSGVALGPCCRPRPRDTRRPALDAGNLLRGLVSCTGSQFCSLALVETKNRALEVGGVGD